MNEHTPVAAILAALAAGDHPFTGLPLPEDHILRDSRVQHALATAAATLDPDMGDGPGADDDERQGAAWSDAEVQRLVEAFDRGERPAAMAKAHGRTTGAIRSRLVYLGLVQAHGDKADARFLQHFERGHLLRRARTEETVERARRLLRAADPDGADARLAEALARYVSGR
ncbi:MAG: hypothetical protein ACKVU4_07575 [Phycisphaerales bacterium]